MLGKKPVKRGSVSIVAIEKICGDAVHATVLLIELKDLSSPLGG